VLRGGLAGHEELGELQTAVGLVVSPGSEPRSAGAFVCVGMRTLGMLSYRNLELDA
jgi:hypothetical protein